MEKLNEILNNLKLKSKNENLKDNVLDRVFSIYPFNRFEYIISYLLAERIISINDYLEIRNDYIKRNKFLHLFEITSPRAFGETWAQNHLNILVPELERPDRSFDPTYRGEYDFYLPIEDSGIKIEVKASRAADANSDEQLVIKALGFASKANFNMNFQQLKPSCCDVFVWIGVWRDKIVTWVMSAKEVQEHEDYSKNQHSHGEKEIQEGQLWITNKNIQKFERYIVEPRDLLMAIVLKGNQK